MASQFDAEVPVSGVGVIGLILIAGFAWFQWYDLGRDLDSVQDRAQIAANPRDMLAYLQTLRDNIEEHGATSGHTALLMKTPGTDLALQFQAINSVIDRLEQIQALPVDSAAYQTALDDLRGVLRETPRIAGGVFWVRYGWWLGLLALVCMGMAGSD